jgi:hypothetical protein
MFMGYAFAFERRSEMELLRFMAWIRIWGGQRKWSSFSRGGYGVGLCQSITTLDQKPHFLGQLTRNPIDADQEEEDLRLNLFEVP